MRLLDYCRKQAAPACLAMDAAVNGGGAKLGGGGGTGGAARDGSRFVTSPRETFLAAVASGGRIRSDMRWLLMARTSRPIRSGADGSRSRFQHRPSVPVGNPILVAVRCLFKQQDSVGASSGKRVSLYPLHNMHTGGA